MTRRVKPSRERNSPAMAAVGTTARNRSTTAGLMAGPNSALRPAAPLIAAAATPLVTPPDIAIAVAPNSLHAEYTSNGW
jgi:hypothetical protein